MGGTKLSDPCPRGDIQLLAGKSSECISTMDQPGFTPLCTLGEVREKLNGDHYLCVQPDIEK